MLKAQSAPRAPTGSKASTQDGTPPAPGPEAQTTKEETGRTDGLSDATEETMKQQEQREEQDAAPGETKEDKFKRLGKARMNRALTAVASIGKLSGSAYTSSDDQRGNMFRALRKAVDDAEASFKPKGLRQAGLRLLTLTDQLDLLEARLAIAAPLTVEERESMPVALRQDGPTFWNAVRNAQAKAWFEGSRAQPPSNKQIWKLYNETGANNFGQLMAFVRFANGYMPECERVTRIHWIYAIDLATRGRNVYGSYEDLLRLSF